MTVDIRAFYHNTNPGKTLNLALPEDQAFYIDFSALRDKELIAELHTGIIFAETESTCQLFTGHIDCGKSTELSRLKTGLEADNFHVVSFVSSDDLEMGDVAVGDILFAIARQISQSLESVHVQLEARGFQAFLRSVNQFLMQEVKGVSFTVPGFGEVGFEDSGGQISLSMGIGKITAQAKNSPELRSRLRDYLEPRTKGIIDAINSELIEPAIAQLKQLGKAGLVVIVDNLDRVENTVKPFGSEQQKYIFIERGDQLRQLNCHLVYTVPLNLCFSNEIGRLRQRFGAAPYILQVVPVEQRDGAINLDGLAKMRELVLVRALPRTPREQWDAAIEELFDSPATLDHLCLMSGGHVRELLMLIQAWIRGERSGPLTRNGLEGAIRSQRNQLMKSLFSDFRNITRVLFCAAELSRGVSGEAASTSGGISV
jgi:hypothetical protein